MGGDWVFGYGSETVCALTTSRRGCPSPLEAPFLLPYQKHASMSRFALRVFADGRSLCLCISDRSCIAISSISCTPDKRSEVSLNSA